MKIQRAGIKWNPTKGDGLPVAKDLKNLLARHGCETVADRNLSRILNCESLPEDGDPGCDVLFVLGGDGTVLKALDYAVPHAIPLIGINLGRMGFLTEIDPADVEADVDRLFAGEYRFDDRPLMEVCGADERCFALNEIVVTRRLAATGILSIETEVGGTLVNRISGDGLIISSATGSTAYSLSAGGPIVMPDVDCLLLTPVCPHTLSARPVIAAADKVITVRVLDDPSEACAMFDGRLRLDLSEELPAITVRRARLAARFIRLRERNYFELLRNKLSDWTH